jgi:CRP-like cAMP-binding protein
MRKRTVIRVITQSDCFGERSMLLSKPRTATVIAKDDTNECWKLSNADFHSMISPGIR